MSSAWNTNKTISLPPISEHHKARAAVTKMKKARAREKKFKYNKDSFNPRDMK